MTMSSIDELKLFFLEKSAQKWKGAFPNAPFPSYIIPTSNFEVVIQPTYELQISKILTIHFDSKGIKIDSIRIFS